MRRSSPPERLGERIDPDTSLVVGSDGLWLAEAEISQREVDGLVSLGTDHDPRPRRFEESITPHIPANA